MPAPGCGPSVPGQKLPLPTLVSSCWWERSLVTCLFCGGYGRNALTGPAGWRDHLVRVYWNIQVDGRDDGRLPRCHKGPVTEDWMNHGARLNDDPEPTQFGRRMNIFPDATY
ncbi:hypothetical protein LZ32DRAFT_322038 [Colletotrichum eremochloae]|nr:hypothetical protein LZ32DRAFT_322038 [Colletotrichum eremochloae]